MLVRDGTASKETFRTHAQLPSPPLLCRYLLVLCEGQSGALSFPISHMAYFQMFVAGSFRTRKTHSDLGHHTGTDRFQCLHTWQQDGLWHEEPDCDEPPLVCAQGKNMSCMFLLSVLFS